MSNHVQNIDLNAAMSNLPTEPIKPSGRVEQPVLRSTISAGGSVTGEAVQKNMEGSTADKPTGSPVFTAIRDKMGNRQHASEATLDSIVTVDGIGEMELRSAINAGFVTKNGDGSFSAGNGEAPQEQQQEQHDDLQGAALPEAEEAHVKQLMEAGASAGDQLAILADIAKGGGIDSHNLSRAASSIGIEPERLHGAIGKVTEYFQKQAEASIGSTIGGLEPAAVWEWAWQEMPRELEKAIYDHGHLRSPRGYAPIAQKFIEQMDQHSPDAILNAELGDGIKSVHRDHSGHMVLTAANGATMTWQAAVKAGLLNVSKGSRG